MGRESAKGGINLTERKRCLNGSLWELRGNEKLKKLRQRFKLQPFLRKVDPKASRECVPRIMLVKIESNHFHRFLVGALLPPCLHFKITSIYPSYVHAS